MTDVIRPLIELTKSEAILYSTSRTFVVCIKQMISLYLEGNHKDRLHMVCRFLQNELVVKAYSRSSKLALFTQISCCRTNPANS